MLNLPSPKGIIKIIISLLTILFYTMLFLLCILVVVYFKNMPPELKGVILIFSTLFLLYIKTRIIHFKTILKK